MSQQCVVPNWNQRHQRQDQVVEGEGGNRSPHVHTPMPRPNYEVAELIWENGQLAMNGLSGLLPTGPTKPTWPNRAGDTLESIVHQATWPKQNPANMSSTTGSSAQKRAEAPGQTHVGPGFVKKRARSELDRCGRNLSGNVIQEERSACASASAAFCKENDATLATWASFESPWSLKTKTTDEDSACQDGSEKLDDDQERKTKAETCRSHSTRRSRAADVHNQSERRRRDRINEKMKALQKLVPNASKTDKASMLDEVIEYLKQLQAQVNLTSSARNMSIPMPMPMPMPMPHMMMPSSSFGMHHQQQQIQMSLLARMGMGMGMGVGLGMGMGMHGPVPPHARHPFVVNPMIQSHAQAQATTDAAAINSSVPFSNPYCTFLGQPMNMDIYNKMAAMYQQQVNQTTQPTNSPLPSIHVQGGIRTP